MEDKALEREEAFCLVVGIHALQFPVEKVGESLRVGGWRTELDNPLVGAFLVFLHEDGGGGEMKHGGSRLLASPVKRLDGVVDDEFLAEGVDE